MSRDFAEMLSALSEAGAEFLIVGAHALAAHGRPRATGDLDIWVRATPENAERVWSALATFGAPLHDLSLADLASPGIVFQMGLPPRRIDILTELTGLTFAEAWAGRVRRAFGPVEADFIGREGLILNKRATARPQDLVDLADLGD